jgi:Anti-sigma-K factor rskA
MNLQTFLTSGLLESYALGSCTPEEEQLVAKMLQQHEAARAELSQIETTMERFASSRAITPPAWMKGKILENIAKDSGGGRPLHFFNHPAFWALSAGLLLLGSFALYQFQQNNGLNRQVTQLEQQVKDCAERAIQQQQTSPIMAFLTNPATQPIKINWLAPEDAQKYQPALAYYNTTTSQVYLNSSMLPAPDGQKDYQFWVVVKDNPNPIPLSVFAPSDIPTVMTYYPDAVAFAVSLEPKGGSPNGVPTAVVMMGARG